MLKLFARKEEHNLKTKLSRSKSIVSFENSFFKTKWSPKLHHAQRLGKEKQMCFPDNINCAIRDNTLSKTSFSHLYLR